MNAKDIMLKQIKDKNKILKETEKERLKQIAKKGTLTPIASSKKIKEINWGDEGYDDVETFCVCNQDYADPCCCIEQCNPLKRKICARVAFNNQKKEKFNDWFRRKEEEAKILKHR